MAKTEIMTMDTEKKYDMLEFMEKAYKFAEIMAKSDIIPEHYRGKPSNVFIALNTAYRLNIDPLQIMQNTYVVRGKLGMSSAFAISLANKSGFLASGIRYKKDGEGNTLRVTACAKLKSNGEEISFEIGMKEAIAEGWVEKPGSKYKTLPELMLMYRSATLLIRTHIPEVLNGMHTTEELEDVKISQESSKVNILERKLDTLLVSPDCPVIESIPEQQDVSMYPMLVTLIEKHNIPTETITKWCEHEKIKSLEDIDEGRIPVYIDTISKRYENNLNKN